MSRLVQESRRDGGATREQLGVLQLLGAVRFHALLLGRQHQSFSPRKTV